MERKHWPAIDGWTDQYQIIMYAHSFFNKKMLHSCNKSRSIIIETTESDT